MTGGDAHGREDGGHDDEVRGARRIPGPRSAADDLDLASVPLPLPPTVPSDPPEEPRPTPRPTAPEPEAAVDPSDPSDPLVLPHQVLKALLGAWALAACSAEETEAVEAHLTECAACADEALRLRDAVGLLHTDRSLDLDPTLRTRVIDACLSRRPANIPVPDWAAPYDAETARLDALLRDIGGPEWHAPVRLKWFEGEQEVRRKTTVAGVIGHLMTVDGLLGTALDLEVPLGDGVLGRGADWPLSPPRAPRSTGPPPGSRPPVRSTSRGARRATPSSARCPSPAAGSPNSPSRTGTSPCRCTTPCWTGPSSAGCTAATSRTRWTIRTSRRPPPISTG